MAHSGAEWWRPAVPTTSTAPATSTSALESKVPFAALMVFTFILLLAPQTLIPGLARLRIALLTGVFAIVAHCWTRFAAGRPLMRFTREMAIVGALLGWVLVTLPLSEWPGGSLQILVNLYLKSLIIFWLLSNTVNTLRRLRTVAWGLTLMAVPLAITGIRNFVSQPAAGRIAGYDAPLTGNPNDLALMLNLILPLTVALFLVSRGGAVRAFLGGLIALDVGAIVATFSRAGFLTLVVILVLYLWTQVRRRQWGWPVLVLLLTFAGIPLLPAGYLDRLGTVINIEADPTGSAQARWKDSGAALDFTLEHPLVGAGLGMNILALNELRGPRWQPVHNVYLEYAMDLGWPGLGLFLFLFVSCIRGAAKVRATFARIPPMTELSALADAIRIALVAFAVAAFFYPVAYNFYFYYFAALAVAAGAVAASEGASSLPHPTSRRGLERISGLERSSDGRE